MTDTDAGGGAVVEGLRAYPVSPIPAQDLDAMASDRRVRSVARNGALGVVGASVGAALGFLLTFVVARSLGTVGSGAFFGAVAVVSILMSLSALGADTGILWALPRNRTLDGGSSMRKTLNRALVPVGAVSIVVATGFWLCAPRLSSLIRPEDSAALTTSLRILSAALLVGPPLQVVLQATRALGNLAPFVAVQQVGLPLSRVAGVVVVAVAAVPSLPHLAVMWVLPLPPALAVMAWVAHRRLRQAERQPHPPGAIQAAQGSMGFWRYSLIRGLGTAGQLSLVWLDVVLVAVLTGAREAGIYAVASRFATSGELALQAMRLATSPQISAAFARNDRKSVRELFSVSAVWAVLFSWPLFLTFIGFGPWLLSMFGAGFEQGALPLAIVCIGMMFSVAAGSVGSVLLMSGHSSWYTMSIGVTLISNIALNLMLVPPLGALGASIAWTLSIIAQNVLGLWLVIHRMKLSLARRGFALHVAMCLLLPSAPTILVVHLLGNGLVQFAINSSLVLAVMSTYSYRRRTFLRLDLLPVPGRAFFRDRKAHTLP